MSARRSGGWARDAFTTPERCFASFFAGNDCPLALMEESGRNRTPDKLPAEERGRLRLACDAALRDVVSRLRPTHVIGIGRFGGERALTARADTAVRTGWAPHPSPSRPAANRGWAKQCTAALRREGIGPLP